MRKRLESFSFIATVAALFAMISFASLLQAQQSTPDTQQTPQTQPAPQTQQPPDTQAPPPTPESGQQTPSQTQPAAPPPDQAQPSNQAAPTDDATGSKEFVGTVVKQGDKYMFQDTATGTMYDIDHQDEVKKFDGKKVRVHGTIDPNTKTIHVQ